MSAATAAIVGLGGDYQPDREVSDEDDPDDPQVYGIVVASFDK